MFLPLYPCKRSGFTLIELMIVITIIGILAVTAGPSYNKMLGRARLADAYTAIDIFKKSEMSYHVEYDTFLRISSKTDDNNFDTDRLVPFASAVSGSGTINKLNYLGWPIPRYTPVSYAVMTIAGKIDETGTELEGNNGDTWDKGWMYPGWYPMSNRIFWVNERDSITCSNSGGPTDVYRIYIDEFGAQVFGLVSANGSIGDWLVTSTMTNISLGDNYCTGLTTLTVFDKENGTYTHTPIVRIGNYE
ncbi:MAG: pilin [Deltaproteobacteria bacterium]|nr:pilin [Deltaproteobacteria bacterium]